MSYLRGIQVKGLGKGEGLLVKSYEELTFAYDSMSFYLGHVLACGVYCQIKAPIGHLTKQNGCQPRQQYHGVA